MGGHLQKTQKPYVWMYVLQKKSYSFSINIANAKAYLVRKGCAMESKPSKKSKGSGALLASYYAASPRQHMPERQM